MKNLLQICAGIFIFLVAASISNLVKPIFLDILLILRIDHQLNFWISNLMSLLLFFLSFILLIKWFNKKVKSDFDKKYLLQLFITYIFIQLLQFIYTLYLTEYMITKDGANYKSLYYDTINSSFFLTVNSIFILCTDLFIFIYLYVRIKKNTDL